MRPSFLPEDFSAPLIAAGFVQVRPRVEATRGWDYSERWEHEDGRAMEFWQLVPGRRDAGREVSEAYYFKGPVSSDDTMNVTAEWIEERIK